MTVKQFIKILKKYPPHTQINYGMNYYRDYYEPKQENQFDLDLFELFSKNRTKKTQKHTLTLWIEE